MFHSGQQIGTYTLINKIGRGGFGEVWLAEKQSKFVTTKVAVKLPLDEQVDHEAIKQEAALWEQASGHPNILPIIDADEYDGQIVIVSEYAPDGSLDQWLKTRGVIPVEKAVEMTIKILDGLEFLHSRNIIHRDLKPANILLQGDTPRLADFGISRAMRATASSQSSNVSGTFAYMPPEGFDGKRSVQTDIWSVGVNLYQFLTGTLPFPQKEPSALIHAIMMRDFEPLPLDVPNNLQNVIARALAKQPENRYATANEMRDDLRRILRGEAVSDFIQSGAQQTFPTEQVTHIRKSVPFSANKSLDENETVVRSMPSLGQSEKRKSSNVWMYATLALVLIIAIGVGVYFLANQSKQNNSNKNEVTQIVQSQTNNNSANSESVNAPSISNANVVVPTPIPTPNKKQLQKQIQNYIDVTLDRKEGMLMLTEEERKKTLFGDLDDDKDEDAVLGVETISYRRGTPDAEGYYIAVFKNDDGQFKFITDTKVGNRSDMSVGMPNQQTNLRQLKDGKILLDTSYYREEDYQQCCPVRKIQIIYALIGNKLAKIKG